MSTRIVALILIGALASGAATTAHGARTTSSPSEDSRLLSRAALRLGHESPRLVIRWLRAQSPVRRAALGRDGRTVSVRFRDGQQSAILPTLQRYVALPALRPLVRPSRPSAAPGAQAAVWEPFATELGLGPNAGDIEVQQLQSAGFAVDQQYDTKVTVARMATLARFNVVYMHTHSGVSAAGDGIVASGEPANGDPAVAPYLQDGSVITVGVAGTAQQYYGITSAFISAHEGVFPAGSLQFLNGCALLRATNFWQALRTRGVAALVSWDQNAAAKDDFLSAAAFFNVMGSGQSVAAAITTIHSAGYGTSSDNGVPASLGFLGDGSVTLKSAAAAGGGSSPPPATNTPTTVSTPALTPAPTETPTSIPAPTSTATSTPVPTHPPVPALVTLSGVVKAGALQHVSVANLVPATSVLVTVTFPDGRIERSRTKSDDAGKAELSFRQPSGTLTRHSRTVLVEVTATTPSGIATTSVHYTIGYGPIDVVVNPRTVPRGGSGAILVHSRARTAVTVTLTYAAGTTTRLHGATGKLGWVKFRYTLPAAARRGQTIAVRAAVRLHGTAMHASTSLTVV